MNLKPPKSPKRSRPAPFRVTRSGYAGVDTCELAVYCSFGSEPKRAAVFERLAEVQRELRSEGDQDVTVMMGEDSIILARTGATGGGGFYPYRFQWRGCQFLAAPFERRGKLPNMLVKVSALFMMSHGGQVGAAWAEIESFLGRMFTAQVGRCCVSRVDIFCDVPMPVHRFFTLFERSGFVRRSRKKSQVGTVGSRVVEMEGGEEAVEYTGKGAAWNTLHLGKGGKASVRFYDKLRELADSGDETKKGMMRKVYWNWEDPAQLTRVEFQLRGEWLRAHGASTITTLQAKLRQVVEYLTTKWLVVCVPGVDRRHTERKREHSIWTHIRETLCERLGVELPADEDLGELLVVPVGRQGLGCLVSFVARMTALSDGLGEWMPHEPNDVRRVLHDTVNFLVDTLSEGPHGRSGEEVLLELFQERWSQQRVKYGQVVEEMGRRALARGPDVPLVVSDPRDVSVAGDPGRGLGSGA